MTASETLFGDDAICRTPPDRPSPQCRLRPACSHMCTVLRGHVCKMYKYPILSQRSPQLFPSSILLYPVMLSSTMVGLSSAPPSLICMSTLRWVLLVRFRHLRAWTGSSSVFWDGGGEFLPSLRCTLSHCVIFLFVLSVARNAHLYSCSSFHA